MTKDIKNVPASVHDRLSRIAKQKGQPFNEILYYYAFERFLYRLSRSDYNEKFVLKGALMFLGWGLSLSRTTRDIDFQGYTTNSLDDLVSIIRDICIQPVEPDGMIYDPESVRGEVIQKASEHTGVRVKLRGSLGRSDINFHIDISFANKITPSIKTASYPTFLDELGMTPFLINGYPYETSIAEKFQTMVALGTINNRIRDFYDVWVLSHQFEIEGQILVDAFTATFRVRSTPIPSDIPIALTNTFVQDKQSEWGSFLRHLPPSSRISPDLSQVITDLIEFLVLPMQAAAKGEKFNTVWRPGKGWR